VFLFRDALWQGPLVDSISLSAFSAGQRRLLNFSCLEHKGAVIENTRGIVVARSGTGIILNLCAARVKVACLIINGLIVVPGPGTAAAGAFAQVAALVSTLLDDRVPNVVAVVAVFCNRIAHFGRRWWWFRCGRTSRGRRVSGWSGSGAVTTTATTLQGQGDCCDESCKAKSSLHLHR